jgi:hypothetical protein
MKQKYVSYAAAYIRHVADAYPTYLRNIILRVLDQSGAEQASALVQIWEPYRKPL